MPKRAVCAEIGVFRGDFSAQILETTRPRVLHLIDPWKYESAALYNNAWYGGEKGGDQAYMDAIFNAVKERFETELSSGAVQIHRSASTDCTAAFPDEYFDWLYVDGNHLYEFVKADLEAYYPKLKPGGAIAGDDYGTRGWWGDGVKRAVDEFCASRSCRKKIVGNSQFIVFKP